MRQYELMIILDPSQDERTVAPSLDKFLEVVRKDKGDVVKVDVWGKRRLAYPIDKKEEGVYAVVDLKCGWTIPISMPEADKTAACDRLVLDSMSEANQ